MPNFKPRIPMIKDIAFLVAVSILFTITQNRPARQNNQSLPTYQTQNIQQLEERIKVLETKITNLEQNQRQEVHKGTLEPQTTSTEKEGNKDTIQKVTTTEEDNTRETAKEYTKNTMSIFFLMIAIVLTTFSAIMIFA